MGNNPTKLTLPIFVMLTQDTPEANAGTVLRRDNDGDYNVLYPKKDSRDGKHFYYSEDTLLKAPEWFQAVEPVWVLPEKKDEVMKLLGGSDE